MSKPLEIFTARELASQGRTPFSRGYIQALKKHGLRFTHGTRTTVKSIYEYVAANPTFRVKDAYPVARSANSKKVSTRQLSPAGNPGER